MSVSNDLKYDAERYTVTLMDLNMVEKIYFFFLRDLTDIGAKNIAVHSLRKVSVLIIACLFGYCVCSYLVSIWQYQWKG